MKIIIIGAGDVGFYIADKLCREGRQVVVIDTDNERLMSLEEHIDAQFINGDGSSPELLKRAGIEQAGMLIAVSNRDEINLVACMVAHYFSPQTLKIARLRNPDYQRYPDAFKSFNIDLFINPEYEACKKIENLLEAAPAIDVVKFADGRVLLVGFRIEAEALMDGSKLYNLNKIMPGYAPLVAAIYRGRNVIVPRGADQLLAGDIAYFAVLADQLPRLLKLTGKRETPIEKVMIAGGSNTGLYLAQQLEQKGMKVKLIERSQARCEELADQLSSTTVLCGESMDAELLEEENVSSMDAFIALSKDEEDNILATLLAKSLGVHFGITLTNRLDYVSLVSSIGIDAAVSPQLAAVSRIMRFLRRGKVRSVEAIRARNAEGIEFTALESSKAVGRPLKEIDFPEGSLVIAIVKENEVFIPSGDTVIQPGDGVVIFATRKAISKVEELFSVKFEYY